jgi:hypothetical protein
LLLLITASAASLVLLALRPAHSAPVTASVPACGSGIDLRLDSDASPAVREAVQKWVTRAADAVCTYYGKYPVPHVALQVSLRGGAGAHHGVTYPSRDGGLIRISVGPETTSAQLDNDWMLTHEMIHLAFPSMAEEHHWIEEGISVYVEPIARVQAGQLSAAAMWSDVARDMPQGEPAGGDQGLDRTHSWGRTYWGGAMFCLVADVRIRQQTKNRKGLQDALRAIMNSGGVISEDWAIERAFAVGDKATGTTVLSDLYREMADRPVQVNLPELWGKLGIQRKADGSVELVSGAPLADIRDAITRPPK